MDRRLFGILIFVWLLASCGGGDEAGSLSNGNAGGGSWRWCGCACRANLGCRGMVGNHCDLFVVRFLVSAALLPLVAMED